MKLQFDPKRACQIKTNAVQTMKTKGVTSFRTV